MCYIDVFKPTYPISMSSSRYFVVKVIAIVAASLALVVYLYAKINHVTPLAMVDKSAYNTYSGIAIKGYDPVSYFIVSPEEGSEEFQMDWNGATWLFSSRQNMELFKNHPQKYAPQFGGYCSFAVTTGFTATVDPEAYTIQDGKLYLFNGQNLKVSFMLETEKSIETAEKKWNDN